MKPADAPITHRRIVAVAGPIVLSNVTVPLLGLVDTGVIGQLGSAAHIGAVGVGAVTLSAFYWVFGFLRMGTTGMTAQAFGAGRLGEVSAMFSRALLIALLGGVGLILCQYPLFWLAFFVTPASAEVETLARQYMEIRVWGAPFAIAVYAVSGWLIALERARSVFVLQLVMNGLNIVLDLLFVLKLGYGVEGVAAASLIAEISGGVLGLWLCRDVFAHSGWREMKRVFHVPTLKKMALVNVDILLRSLMLLSIFTSFVIFGAGISDAQLAANQILLQFLYVTAYAMDGFAFGAETFVGQGVGAKDRVAVRRASIMSSQWGFGICVILAGLFLFGGEFAIFTMTTAADVRLAAVQFLPYMVLAPLLGWPSWMLDGIFIGATKTSDMRNMMALSTIAYFLTIALLLPLLQNHGLWIALLVSFIARGLTLLGCYPKLERSVSANASFQ